MLILKNKEKKKKKKKEEKHTYKNPTTEHTETKPQIKTRKLKFYC